MKSGRLKGVRAEVLERGELCQDESAAVRKLVQRCGSVRCQDEGAKVESARTKSARTLA